MRLYNQTKKPLSWKMDGEIYECESWGAILIPDEIVYAVKARGLPLDVTPVAPELRAQERIADQHAANRDAPLHALKKAVDDAQAAQRAAKAEVESLQVELSKAREHGHDLAEQLTAKGDALARAVSEKEAAESLLSEAGKRATDAEERAIRAEAMLAELQKEPASQPKGDKPDKKPKPDKPAQPE